MNSKELCYLLSLCTNVNNSRITQTNNTKNNVDQISISYCTAWRLYEIYYTRAPGREGNTTRGVAECCIFPRDRGPSVIYLIQSNTRYNNWFIVVTGPPVP